MEQRARLKAEQQEAIKKGIAEGLSSVIIAQRVGCGVSTVNYYKSKHRTHEIPCHDEKRKIRAADRREAAEAKKESGQALPFEEEAEPAEVAMPEEALPLSAQPMELTDTDDDLRRKLHFAQHKLKEAEKQYERIARYIEQRAVEYAEAERYLAIGRIFGETGTKTYTSAQIVTMLRGIWDIVTEDSLEKRVYRLMEMEGRND